MQNFGALASKCSTHFDSGMGEHCLPIWVMGQWVSGWREYMKACKEEVLS